MQKYYCRKESTGKETVQNQIQRGDAVFRINGYYVIIPQFLYDILLFGGSLASLAALGMLVKDIVQKKKHILYAGYSYCPFQVFCSGLPTQESSADT